MKTQLLENIRSVVVTAYVLPHPRPPSRHCSMFPPTVTEPDANKQLILSLFCIYSTVFSQSQQRRQPSKQPTWVKQALWKAKKKGRSMFPKVLLQWCAAISSCAAEIGKHGSTTVRLSALSASYLCCEVMAL